MENIHVGATPIKSRAIKIRTFRHRDVWMEQVLAVPRHQLNEGAKIVAVRIALHYNIKTGQCNPSIKTLVRGSGVSESTARRHIEELTEKGWLHAERTLGRVSNSYELRSPTLSHFERVKSDPNPVTYNMVDDFCVADPTLSHPAVEPCHTVTDKNNELNSEEESYNGTTEVCDSGAPQAPQRLAPIIDVVREDEIVLDRGVGLRPPPHPSNFLQPHRV